MRTSSVAAFTTAIAMPFRQIVRTAGTHVRIRGAAGASTGSSDGRRGGGRVVLGQVDQRGLHAAADVLGVAQVELEEDRVDRLRAWSGTGREPRRSRPLAISARTSSSRKRNLRAVGDQAVDDPRVDDRAALGHGADGGQQIRAVGDPLLEQVRAPLGAGGEQLDRAARLGQLAEDHDDLGVRLGAAAATSIPAPQGRHPDVVVTDIRMPPTQHRRGHPRRGASCATTHPEIGVVVLSQYAEPAYALALLESGSERPRLPAQGARPRPRAAAWPRSRGRRGRLGDRPEDRRGARRRARRAPSARRSPS